MHGSTMDLLDLLLDKNNCTIPCWLSLILCGNCCRQTHRLIVARWIFDLILVAKILLPTAQPGEKIREGGVYLQRYRSTEVH